MLLTLLSTASAATRTADSLMLSAVLEPSSGTILLQPRQPTFTGWMRDEAAWASYNDSAYLATGWARLEVHTNPDVEDSTAALAAGMLEGSLTSVRIHQSAVNSGFGPAYTLPKNISAFVDANAAFIAMMGATAKHSTQADRAYWHQISLVYTQLQGIHLGYMQAAQVPSALPPLSLNTILAMNMGDELGNFAGYSPGDGVERTLPKFGDLQPFLDAGKCSALIKLLADGSDILIAQETWSSLESQLRVYKMYNFPYTLTGQPGSSRVPAKRVSFPSYPAAIASGDDFYTLSTGAHTMEPQHAHMDICTYAHMHTLSRRVRTRWSLCLLSPWHGMVWHGMVWCDVV